MSRSSSGFLRARQILSLAPGVQGDSIQWESGRITRIGPAGELQRSVPAGVPQYDLPDTLVTPGLVDGHTHLALWALNRRRVQLSGSESLQQVLQLVAAAQPVRGWVVGQGWNANGWPDPPDRHGLDRVQSHPVYLDSLDVHAAWLNTAALHAAGIKRETPEPYGGRIVRDANGEPTGLLLERAVELVTPHLPKPTADELDQALRDAQAEAHRLGVTGIQEVEDMATLEAFHRLEAGQELRLRVLFHPPVAALPQLIGRRVKSGDGSDWLTIGGVKMFLDGSLGSRTAWMLEPYEGTQDRGMPISTIEAARSAMLSAASAGIATTVHAIGDAAVQRALDLLEKLPAVGLPHRIEHFQCAQSEDIRRAGSSGLVISMQPAHLLTDIPLIEQHWGQRGKGAYAFASLLRQGAHLVFGSDVPVASLDPRSGIYSALERRAGDGTPVSGWRSEEKLSFVQALSAYTVAAATAGGAAGRRGKLAPGFDADLVAWSVDEGVTKGHGAAFRDARALLTVVGGECVMRV